MLQEITVKVGQWWNAKDSIQWFKKITNGEGCTFLKYDIADFYSSITEEKTGRSIDLAREFLAILMKMCK